MSRKYHLPRATEIARLKSHGWTVLRFKTAPVTLAFHRERDGKVQAKAWRGERADVPAFYIMFRNEARCRAHVDEFIASVAASVAFRAEHNRKPTPRFSTRAVYDAANPHPLYLAAAAGQYIGPADLANLCRYALARAFPGVKFSIRSKSYSGGSSVSVHWTDGPTTKQVDAIIGNFETKGFDGSIDLGYCLKLWLYPDGSAHVAHTSGTEGSMGCHSEIIESARNGSAVLLENVSSTYIHSSRRSSAALLQRALDSVRAENWRELESVDWSQVRVACDSSVWACAQVLGAPSVKVGGHWLQDFIYQRANQIDCTAPAASSDSDSTAALAA